MNNWLLFLLLVSLTACPATAPEPLVLDGGDPPEEAVTLLLVGDTMLGRLVNDMLQTKPPAYPWGDTQPVLEKAGVRICNLECVISERGRPWSATPKVFHFRSDAKNVAVLSEAGIDLVSLANNHALDYGYDALLQMLDLLDDAGIGHAGAGRNLAEACRPAVIEAGGMRFGVLAFTDNEPVWEATAEGPGTCYAPIDVRDKRGQQLLELVREARARVDFLIVSAHWGPNWGYEPPAAHIRFGHALVDAGADLVFGHSAHIFGGVEIYQGKPILYSTGDFVDDYMVDKFQRNDQSFIFTLRVAGGSVREMRLYPTVIRHLQARMATANEAGAIAAKMQNLCFDLGTPTEWNPANRYLRIPNRLE